jgi:type III secretion system low calcium response chaperone LcrH/SycD
MQELVNVVRESDALTDAQVEQFYAYAFAQYRCGGLQKAAEVFHVLCARRPFEARFWFGFAATLQEERKYEGALRAWAMAALLDQLDPYPHFHAAECSFSMNNLQDASLALKETEQRIVKNHPLEDRIPLLKEAWKL